VKNLWSGYLLPPMNEASSSLVSNDFGESWMLIPLMIDKGVQKLRFRSMEEVAQNIPITKVSYGWYSRTKPIANPIH
jgi:hypothetical protein